MHTQDGLINYRVKSNRPVPVTTIQNCHFIGLSPENFRVEFRDGEIVSLRMIGVLVTPIKAAPPPIPVPDTLVQKIQKYIKKLISGHKDKV